MRKRRDIRRRTTKTVTAHAILLGACVAIIVPFLYLFATSFKYFRDIVSGALVFTPTLVNYAELFGSDSDFSRLILNSVVVATFAMLVCLGVGSLGAYSITRFHWHPWIPHLMLGWLVIVQTVPAISLVGPFYYLSRQLGLHDTKLLLILVHTLMNLPLVVWTMIAYFQSIPRDYEEAAIIDGANWWVVFVRIILPISTPAIAATGVLIFIFSWKEFLLALSLTSTPAAMTLPVGIAAYIQDFQVQYGEMSAAAAVSTVPGLLLAAFAQRYIVAGLLAGSVKS